jgi:hypothetical protein
MLETPVGIWPLRVHKKRFHIRDSAYIGFVRLRYRH